MSIDAMKQALEVLELLAKWEHPASNITTKTGGRIYPHKVASDAATALRAAIEQAQEPVAYTLNCVCGAVWDVSPDGVEEMVHAPTPPPRQWQGLTDEEIENMMDYWSEPARSAYGGAHTANGEYVCIADIIRDAEAKLKEKNT